VSFAPCRIQVKKINDISLHATTSINGASAKSGFDNLESQRLKRARLRLAEAQGIIPIGASENSNINIEV